jgi:hypothetical protein
VTIAFDKDGSVLDLLGRRIEAETRESGRRRLKERGEKILFGFAVTR